MTVHGGERVDGHHKSPEGVASALYLQPNEGVRVPNRPVKAVVSKRLDAVVYMVRAVSMWWR